MYSVTSCGICLRLLVRSLQHYSCNETFHHRLFDVPFIEQRHQTSPFLASFHLKHAWSNQISISVISNLVVILVFRLELVFYGSQADWLPLAHVFFFKLTFHLCYACCHCAALSMVWLWSRSLSVILLSIVAMFSFVFLLFLFVFFFVFVSYKCCK